MENKRSELLTTKQFCYAVNASRATAWRWLREMETAGISIGERIAGHRFYSEKDVRTFVAFRAQHAAANAAGAATDATPALSERAVHALEIIACAQVAQACHGFGASYRDEIRVEIGTQLHTAAIGLLKQLAPNRITNGDKKDHTPDHLEATRA